MKLNEKQLDRFSEYLANFSLLIFGTVVIPQFIGEPKLQISNLIFGVMATMIFLFISLELLK
jgi:hypothetical protein